MKWILFVIFLDLTGTPRVAITAEFDSFTACQGAAEARVKAAKDRRTYDIEASCSSKSDLPIPTPAPPKKRGEKS